MKLWTARLSLFILWFALFLAYLISFIVLPEFKPSIDAGQSRQAAWTVGYILAPVIVAFGFFFLGPAAKQNLAANDDETISGQQVVVMFFLTLGLHLAMFVYLFVAVWNHNFNFPDDAAKSFTGVVNEWFKCLVFFGNIPVIAVNFVLGRSDIQLASGPSQSGTQATATPKQKKEKG